MRRAAKVDANQAAIVAALRQIGARAVYIKEPVDLLVGFRGVNYLLEVKNADGKDEITRAQAAFMATWPAPVHIVKTPREAIDVLTQARRA
jgi:hypothetical protein